MEEIIEIVEVKSTKYVLLSKELYAVLNEQISNAITSIQDWGPRFKYSAKCSKCSHKNDLSTELNPTAFFIQPSSRETQT